MDAYSPGLIATEAKGQRRQRAADQQPHRLHLHRRQMHDRPEVAIYLRGCSSRVENVLGLPQNTMKSASWTRNAGPRSTSRHASKLPRTACSSTPGSWTAPAMKIHLDGGRPDGAQGHHERASRGSWHRKGPQRRCRLGRRVQRPGPGRWGMWTSRADGRHGRDKIAQPRAEASTTWVPSPTAAALHALHTTRSTSPRCSKDWRGGACIEQLLSLAGQELAWAPDEIREEVDSNCPSSATWFAGLIKVSARKVPDIHDVALMEDQATLRISSNCWPALAAPPV